MNDFSLKIAFAGTPDIAAAILSFLLQKNYNIAVVYCQPDRLSGRGKKKVLSPVKQLAIKHNIPIEQPLHFKDSILENNKTPLEQLVHYDIDLMIVIAYGVLLPESILETPRFGCLNIHASLLPRWRGAAPIQRVIEENDKVTGITIMQMDKGLDTGNILYQCEQKLVPNETSASLYEKLTALGGLSIHHYLSSIDWNKENKRSLERLFSIGEKQKNKNSTYAKKLSKSEGNIDWSLPAAIIERKIRAFNVWPVAFTYMNKKRIRIWKAMDVSHEFFEIKSNRSLLGATILDSGRLIVVCGDGFLEIKILQTDGGRALSVTDFLNGKSHWFNQNERFNEQ
jgi:methionyl-tRNA formyltransferase